MDGRDTGKDKGIQYVKEILQCPVHFVIVEMGLPHIEQNFFDRMENEI